MNLIIDNLAANSTILLIFTWFASQYIYTKGCSPNTFIHKYLHMSLLKKEINLYKRVIWAKSIGLGISVFGLLFFLFVWVPQGYNSLLLALFFWYPMIGGIVGLIGILDHHPLLKWKLGISRAIMVWGFMNFLLMLLAGDKISGLLTLSCGIDFSLSVLYVLATLEWAIVAGLMDYITTQKFGEGKKLMNKK